MADYFTNFSLIVPLPTEAAEKYALDFVEQVERIQHGNEAPTDFPASLKDVVDDWHFDTVSDHSSGGYGLWLHTSNGGVDAVCAFIQHLLQRFNPEASVSLEWSNDCSKPRVDAFGGGAAFITATKINSISTGQWLHRQNVRLKTHKPRQQ